MKMTPGVHVLLLHSSTNVELSNGPSISVVEALSTNAPFLPDTAILNSDV